MIKRLSVGSAIAFLITSSIFALPTPNLESKTVDCREIRISSEEFIKQVEELKETRNLEIVETANIEQIEEIVEEPIIEEIIEVTYNPYNLLETSNITREQAYEILEGSALQTLYRGYVHMEEMYGINALFLMALSSEESAHGTSSLAMYNNNIGGIKAKDGSWAVFNDWYDCLSYKADLLKNCYLSEEGSYFNGYSIWDVNEKYCEQKTWSENLNQIAYELLYKIN